MRFLEIYLIHRGDAELANESITLSLKCYDTMACFQYRVFKVGAAVEKARQNNVSEKFH